MEELYAEIIINSDAITIDREFTYYVRKENRADIKIGHRVMVPFGKGNRKVEGFVVSLKSELMEHIKGIKEVYKILDKEPVMTEENIKLIKFLRQRYMCKYIDAIRSIIPSGLLNGMKDKIKSVVCVNNELDESLINNPKYVFAYNYIKENNKLYTRAEIVKNNPQITTYILKRLLDKEIISIKEEIVHRYNDREYNNYAKVTYNVEQHMAIHKILNSKNKGFLLKGVTGSGKTEVYMALVEKTIEMGKSAIILVPEIALTPQMIERFKGRFGKNVSVYHSKLSIGERFDEWYRIKRGDVNLVVGARSAIFLPFKNLGLIIVDEEHENSYKADNNPKYDTREVAEYLSLITGCKFVLGSATPSVTSYYNSLIGKLSLVEMNSRVSNCELPSMEIVDMRNELKLGNMSLLSGSLKKEIKKALDNKEQIILFLNRRGFSTFVSCRSCGFVFKCDSCDVSMTYHKNGYLVCHYCGKAIKTPKICPKCSSKYVKFFGSGTERVEMEVKKYFPFARTIRMDVDTTRSKDAYEKIYNSFKNGEGDILIGTQMVSKGLDFKNVTLVGILAADISLNIPDFRANERTYQIITQVAGRAGRGDKKGRVVVQSYTPENSALKYSMQNDYISMVKEEIRIRKVMNNPPFSDIYLINCLSKDEKKLVDFMKLIKNNIYDLANENNLQVIGPSSCIIGKIKENYRWQIILKGNINDNLRIYIKDLLYQMHNNVYNDIRISLDVNPNNLI
ncbi:MAG: primosomal protein N' [Clostridium sp.]|nr:primosomal protein N' [Clostridium sp.]MDY3827628.1 primosomal protein N' [Clostridium sp.]